MSESLLLLDACCAINLLASSAADEILQALPHEVAVARLVFEREVLYVRAEDGEVPVETEVAHPEEVGVELSLRPLADQGLLHVLEPETHEEHATWVDLALQLDDGEAMTGALAIHRNALLATDDRKAIRVLGQRLPEHRILRTSELLKDWADGGAPTEGVRDALEGIEHRASFRPPRGDPLAEWWAQILDTP